MRIRANLTWLIVFTAACANAPDAGEDRVDERGAHEQPEVTASGTDYQQSRGLESLDDPEPDTDEGFYHPASDLEFEGFTHFPVDFVKLYSAVDTQWERQWPSDIVAPFFFHEGRMATRKWYIYDFSDPPHTKVYVPADAYCGLDGFAAPEDVIALEGETVHVNTRLFCRMSEHLRVVYSHITLRDEVVRRIEDAAQDDFGSQDAFFAAGEHVGYMYFPAEDHTHTLDFEVFDGAHTHGKVSNPEHFLNTGVNPLDYFVDELREELIRLNEPMRDLWRHRGTAAFSDITDSRGNINVEGTLEGLWFRNDLPLNDLPVSSYWDMLSFVAVENIHTDTYWRVLEHPWVRENNFAGIFNEWPFGSGPPDTPLFEGPLYETARLYLLDGDLSAGVAMILNPGGWNPNEKDHDGNHPSLAERRYLRFQVDQADHMWQEILRIQGFITEDEALAGFTSDVLEYRRDPEILPSR